MPLLFIAPRVWGVLWGPLKSGFGKVSADNDIGKSRSRHPLRQILLGHTKIEKTVRSLRLRPVTRSATASRRQSTSSRKAVRAISTAARRGQRTRCPLAKGLDFDTQPANRMLLEEAFRSNTVLEGERTIELPVIKAVFRSFGVSAMKGNRLNGSHPTAVLRTGVDALRRRIAAAVKLRG
jgi:hypothetical protein